jgi:hypothetical protein
MILASNFAYIAIIIFIGADNLMLNELISKQSS